MARVQALRHIVHEDKRALNRTRQRLQEHAAALKALEARCRALGIELVIVGPQQA